MSRTNPTSYGPRTTNEPAYDEAPYDKRTGIVRHRTTPYDRHGAASYAASYGLRTRLRTDFVRDIRRPPLCPPPSTWNFKIIMTQQEQMQPGSLLAGKLPTSTSPTPTVSRLASDRPLLLRRRHVPTLVYEWPIPGHYFVMRNAQSRRSWHCFIVLEKRRCTPPEGPRTGRCRR